MTHRSQLEEQMRVILLALDAPEWVEEYRFAPPRRWRMDFAIPSLLIAIEAEGGTWTGGRHTRGDGFERDCIKYNEAAIAGWIVLRFTSDMINDGSALEQIERAIFAKTTPSANTRPQIAQDSRK